jgi:hypothetical protein
VARLRRERALVVGKLKVDDPGLQAATREAPRKYVTVEQAQLHAERNYSTLWRIDNKSEWARQLECSRETVEKLKAWKDAKARRDGVKKMTTRLEGVLDPRTIDALNAGDVSVLEKLTAEEEERRKAMSKEDKAEIQNLLNEQFRDAIS